MKTISILLLFLFIIIVGCEQQIKQPVSVVSTTTETQNPKEPIKEGIFNQHDKFLVIVGGKLNRSITQYDIKESFTPKIVDNGDYSPWEKSQFEKESIYKIETVNDNGRKNAYYTSLTYCPKNTDVCLTFRLEELAILSGGYLRPIAIIMSPDIVEINFYIKDILVKSIKRDKTTPRIINLNKKVTKIKYPTYESDGYELTWDIDKEKDNKAWVSFEYLSLENKWQYIFFEDVDDNRRSFKIDSATYSISDDFRFVITDGFHANSLILEDLISTT